jgi:hypothetical protein
MHNHVVTLPQPHTPDWCSPNTVRTMAPVISTVPR